MQVSWGSLLRNPWAWPACSRQCSRQCSAVQQALQPLAVQLQQVTEMSVFSYNTACRQHNESGSKGRGGSHTLKALPRERPQPAAAGGAAGGGGAAAAAGGAAAYGELPPIGFPATVAAAQVVRDMGRDGACRRPAQPAAASCNFVGPALEGSWSESSSCDAAPRPPVAMSASAREVG